MFLGNYRLFVHLFTLHVKYEDIKFWNLITVKKNWLAQEDFKIIWLSNILSLSVPDQGYSRKCRAQ